MFFMGRKNRRRQQEQYMRKVSHSAIIVPMNYKKWHTEPEDTDVIANEIFGARYYCVGDRKIGRIVEQTPKD